MQEMIQKMDKTEQGINVYDGFEAGYNTAKKEILDKIKIFLNKGVTCSKKAQEYLEKEIFQKKLLLEMNNKELVKFILNKINKYLRRENKIIADIRKEWKDTREYKTYSNQYYAFFELRDFWLELKKQIEGNKK